MQEACKFVGRFDVKRKVKSHIVWNAIGVAISIVRHVLLVIGIVVTTIVCLIINAVVSPFGVPAIAVLTLPIIGIMIGLSILLSVLAGFIPSMHASRQDPVVALRSE